MTLSDAEQAKKLADAEQETAKVKERKEAARRQRLSRAKRAVAKIEEKTARAKLREFSAELYNDILEHSKWLAEGSNLTPEQARAQEAKLIIAEVRDIDAWEANLSWTGRSDLINSASESQN